DYKVTGVQTCALPIWPDTSGPYFKTADWAGTDRVKEVLGGALSHEKPQITRALVIDLLKHKIDFPALTAFVSKAAATDPEFRTRSEERRVGKECRCWW